MTASVFDRLARRPARRVTSRLTERFSNGFASRLGERLRCRSNRNRNEDNEKNIKKPRHWLNVFTTTNRVWQFLSSLILYGIYMHFVMNERSETQPEQARRAAISALAPVTIMYHSNILLINCLLRKSKSRETRGWRFVSFASILGDLLMMRLSLSKMNVLSAAGALAECKPEQSSFFKAMLKNGAAIAYRRFGWASGPEPEEFDVFCCLPKIVYLLCGIAIFSYTFSVLFTGLQLQRHWPGNDSTLHSGHVEEAIPQRPQPVQVVFVPRSSFATPRPLETAEVTPETVAPTQTFNAAARQSLSTTRSTSEDLPRYTNAADEYITPQVRSSMETTSSFNPDLYLISDGFRPAPELPTYTSRPPSFRGRPPSYSSRPSSIRNI